MKKTCGTPEMKEKLTQTITGGLPKFPEDPDYQVKVEEVKKHWQKKKLSLSALAEELVACRAEKKEEETRIAAVNLEFEALAQLVLGKLEDEDLHSINTNDGVTVYAKASVYPSVQDKALLFQWIKKTKAVHLLTVQFQSLKGLCSDLLSNGKDIPPGVKCFLKNGIGVRGGKS